ncbi:MAG: DNA-binding protein HU [Candidatus Colwellbacteria bacterium CG10_big_fil_rev_8_21_14_0_10_42_22]|uniref:DNA-binding protein HU n=1 Tax=Candidatus Colwellbacteria bacterium CG10_big_fil_rev_8_21_14_0_10_42_22 TaxID=1974540 RepID=A0A2H0VGR1_9BACT|nr:MAG: DNA-binding protein HU [Candidatus Colwellbacteria bacterium CG10_big_fil_rev_8_21_14_0_10_42_22]
MKKTELVEEVMSAAGLDTKKDAEAAVDAVFEVITKSLSRGEEVAVTGFGTFKVSKRSARQGINPRTGEKIQIAAKTVPKFSAGKGLKDAVA